MITGEHFLYPRHKCGNMRALSKTDLDIWFIERVPYLR